jgi:hypothetical protein
MLQRIRQEPHLAMQLRECSDIVAGERSIRGAAQRRAGCAGAGDARQRFQQRDRALMQLAGTRCN